MGTGKRRVTTVQEFDEITGEVKGEEHDENEDVALFDLSDDADGKKIVNVAVHRMDPKEGYLGVMPASATEQDILAKWGGSEYRLEAKNDRGKIVKVRTVAIAGEPVFASDIAEARWRRVNGLRPRETGAPAQPEDRLNMKDVLLIMEEREEKRRAEQWEREERARRDRDEREEKLRREQMEREDKWRRDAADMEVRRLREEAEREERRARMAREDEERRARQHKEDLERVAAQNAAQIAQTQQMMQMMMGVMKSEKAAVVDPTAMLLKGVELAQAMQPAGNGEPQDALTTILSRLPETLREARETASAAYREVKGGGGGEEGEGGEDSLTITGPVASKVRAMVNHLIAQGKDPEAVINKVADHLLGVKAAPAQPAAASRGGGAKRALPPKRRARKPAPAKPAPRKPAAPPATGAPAA